MPMRVAPKWLAVFHLGTMLIEGCGCHQTQMYADVADVADVKLFFSRRAEYAEKLGYGHPHGSPISEFDDSNNALVGPSVYGPFRYFEKISRLCRGQQ